MSWYEKVFKALTLLEEASNEISAELRKEWDRIEDLERKVKLYESRGYSDLVEMHRTELEMRKEYADALQTLMITIGDEAVREIVRALWQVEAARVKES